MPSTAISHLAYDAANRELLVIFTSGRRYLYADVAPELFTAFSHAPSRGAFFNQEVRDRYAYREVTPGSGADRHRRRG
ncbi:MAG TPA: KTSC domain-containing protein [Tardiphaga sp.]